MANSVSRQTAGGKGDGFKGFDKKAFDEGYSKIDWGKKVEEPKVCPKCGKSACIVGCKCDA